MTTLLQQAFEAAAKLPAEEQNILASRLLAEGGHVAAVAEKVGYESEAAFSRAFKKVVGKAPAAWRRAATPLTAGELC